MCAHVVSCPPTECVCVCVPCACVWNVLQARSVAVQVQTSERVREFHAICVNADAYVM